VVALLHGLWITRGLVVPPDIDAIRDIGFAQGFLDGNWMGDPAYGGAARYYPPLIPALEAAAIALAGIRDIPRAWVMAGPWLNLLVPLAFFPAAWRLLDEAGAALCALAVFVLAVGTLSVPWMGAGYTPWLLTPMLAQAAFLGSLWLTRGRIETLRLRNAPLLGLAYGLTLLAHPVPALLLSTMLALAILILHGRRGVPFLALAGLTEALVALPYLLPLLLLHPDGILNPEPGAWVAPLLRQGRWHLAQATVLNLPGALATIVLWRLRGAMPLSRPSVLLLAGLIGTCAAMLLRHQACTLLAEGVGPALCRLPGVPVHHFHLYLQLGWAFVLGHVLWHGAGIWARGRPERRRLLGRAIAAALLVGAAAIWLRPYDGEARARCLIAGDLPMDLALYRWVLVNTPPEATFVTAGEDDIVAGEDVSGSFAVWAAGRRFVALYPLFSNPYVSWTAHEAARKRAMLWLRGDVPACVNVGESLWAVLPAGFVVGPGRAQKRFDSGVHAVWHIARQGCEPSG
jgi:hypothetical protein